MCAGVLLTSVVLHDLLEHGLVVVAVDPLGRVQLGLVDGDLALHELRQQRRHEELARVDARPLGVAVLLVHQQRPVPGHAARGEENGKVGRTTAESCVF